MSRSTKYINLSSRLSLTLDQFYFDAFLLNYSFVIIDVHVLNSIDLLSCSTTFTTDEIYSRFESCLILFSLSLCLGMTDCVFVEWLPITIEYFVQANDPQRTTREINMKSYFWFVELDRWLIEHELSRRWMKQSSQQTISDRKYLFSWVSNKTSNVLFFRDLSFSCRQLTMKTKSTDDSRWFPLCALSMLTYWFVCSWL
jgi:hypothetical protein